ncbi:MAG: hypothetical protein H6843_09820 [Rhodospirillaceae bacterium]|nr:hypothetical protein [Rhodospirillaceae bacterium]
MKAMKIIFLVIGGLVVLGGGVIALVFYLTAGAADSADALFARIASGDVRGAYESTAPQLQRQQDYEAFAAVVATLGLEDYESSSWNSRSITNDRATVSGTVTLADGSVVPMQVDLVEVDDAWLVYAFGGQASGAFTEGGQPPLPTLEAARALATSSLAGLADAINRADFTGFYADTSAMWRAQATAADLQRGFQSYIDNGVDLAPAATATPEFSLTPFRDAVGALVLAGYLPSGDAPVYFRLRYVFEAPEWRLIGIRVGDAPPEPFDGE